MCVYYPKPAILEQIPLDRPAVIEAAAGTGKTYTIEHLWVQILLSQDVSIENILVLTFTEKAASELKARIRAMLERITRLSPTASPPEGPCWKISAPDKNRLLQALCGFDRAPIHTIHSLFQQVITENAFTGGRLFQQHLMDGKTLFHDAFLQVLRDTLAEDATLSEYLSFYLENLGSVEGLSQLLWNCHKARCPIQPTLQRQELTDSILAVNDALADVDHLEQELDLGCRAAAIHHSTRSKLQRQVQMLMATTAEFREVRNLPAFLQAMDEPMDFPYICENLQKIQAHGSFFKRLAEKVLLLKDCLLPVQSLIVQQFLPIIQARLEEEKRRQGHYDFDDMSQSLWQGLQGKQGPALLKMLRSRYRFGLIDESQDTDTYQWKIFRRLFLVDLTTEAPGNILYLIGDPKQAIYGFRGADVYTYLTAKEEIHQYLDAREGVQRPRAPIALSDNYRSTPPLIDAFNTLFDQQVEAPFFSGSIRYEIPVRYGYPEMQALDDKNRQIVPVKIVSLSSDRQKWTVGEYRKKMGRFIAAEIKGLLSGSGLFIQKDRQSAVQPLRPGEIFILTRYRKEGAEVSEYLRRMNIPFAFYKQDGLFQTNEAQEIRDLLAAVEQPGDQSRRFQAWMTPFFNFPLESLADCGELPDTEAAGALLLEWHQLARQHRYRELFPHILRQSGLIKRELLFKTHERQLTNYLHIFEILLEEFAGSTQDISELVMALNGYIAETRQPVRENGNLQRLETERDSVQIMTMHNSKGLQASVVFLYGGVTRRPAEEVNAFHTADRQRWLWVGKPIPVPIKEWIGQEEEGDDQRLLYVATTRAKARLYLPYILPNETGSLNGPYIKQMNQRLHTIVPKMDPRVFELIRSDQVAAGVAEEAALPDLTVLQGWRPPELFWEELDDTAKFSALRRLHAGIEVTSYSRIKSLAAKQAIVFSDPEYGEEAQATFSAPATAEYIGGPAFGSALHRILETLPMASLQSGSISMEAWSASEEISALFRQALLDSGIDSRYLGYTQRMVYQALTAAVRVADQHIIPGLCTLPACWREMEFYYPYPENGQSSLTQPPSGEAQLGKGLVKGFIDLLFVHEGRIYFVDWKTDTLPDYGEASLQLHFEENYLLQTKLYLLALCKMFGLQDREKVASSLGGALYCFVRGMGPDPSGCRGIFFVCPSWEELLAYEQELLDHPGYIGGEAHA